MSDHHRNAHAKRGVVRMMENVLITYLSEYIQNHVPIPDRGVIKLSPFNERGRPNVLTLVRHYNADTRVLGKWRVVVLRREDLLSPGEHVVNSSFDFHGWSFSCISNDLRECRLKIGRAH